MRRLTPDRWTELARASTPDGDELILRRRGEEYDIRFNGWEVMASRTSRSEEALARLAFEDLRRRPRDVLIGGLGMGYTLRAALDLADADARVVVAELVPAVVEWVKGPLAELARNPLADRRVEVSVSSVVAMLAASPQSFDVILLDTDNGPEVVLHPANAFLYSREGVALALQSLKPDGRLAYWSADRSAAFESVLDATNMSWRRIEVDASGDGDDVKHSIYLAHPAASAEA